MNARKNSRSLWPIAIIAFFVVAIVYLGGFIVWASRQREDLVSENYYETEIRYQQQIDRLNRSQKFDSESLVTYDTAQQSIVISLPTASASPVTGEIRLYRPSDARLDHEFPLEVGRSGVQRLDAKRLPGGLWKVRVTWTVNGQEYFCDRPVVVPG